MCLILTGCEAANFGPGRPITSKSPQFFQCPPGYVFQLASKMCVWRISPRQMFEEVYENSEAIMELDPTTSVNTYDPNCPNGYKFSEHLQLCLLHHFCNFCRTENSNNLKMDQASRDSSVKNGLKSIQNCLC